MTYTVTQYDITQMLLQIKTLALLDDDTIAYAYLRTAIYTLAGYIGCEIVIDENDYDNAGTLPTQLQGGVLVPYVTSLVCVGEITPKTENVGGVTLTYDNTAKPRMSDYKAIYSRYKRLKTPYNNANAEGV